MKSFSEFLKEVDDPQQSALSAHQARTAGMRQAKSGTIGDGGSKTPFRKRPSTGLSSLLKRRKKEPPKPAAKKPNITPLRPKTKPNPITKGLGARPA